MLHNSKGQISYGSIDTSFRDKKRFPFFYRTVPNEELQTLGISRLIVHFGWTWIGLIATDNEEGEKFILNLKKEFVRKGVCIAFTKLLSSRAPDDMKFQIKQQIMTSSSNIIVLYGTTDYLIWIKVTFVSYAVSGKVLLTTSQWDFLSNFFPLHSGFLLFHGTLTFALHTTEIVGFREFLQTINHNKYPDDIFMRYFWVTAFHCFIPFLDVGSMFWPLCTGNERTQELPIFRFDFETLDLSYNIYKAVYAIAKALHDVSSSRYGPKPLQDRLSGTMHNIKPWKVVK
ncbi:hypothetical protein lerEdw1_011286 [Lerista edwardsae]|nr:hypothetical protein lerEdw1_011286 [Lerista edwardsae]